MIMDLFKVSLFSATLFFPHISDNRNQLSDENRRLLTCLVFSMQTIPLLKELQLSEKDASKSDEVKSSVEAVGGKDKIAVAMLDAELVIEAMAKKVSEKHIIKIDEKLLDNTMWRLANGFYAETVKDKPFNQRFSETFKYTQSCIDRFLH
jgi:hypothetical protein